MIHDQGISAKLTNEVNGLKGKVGDLQGTVDNLMKEMSNANG